LFDRGTNISRQPVTRRISDRHAREGVSQFLVNAYVMIETVKAFICRFDKYVYVRLGCRVVPAEGAEKIETADAMGASADSTVFNLATTSLRFMFQL
jgi:hypothetical protein